MKAHREWPDPPPVYSANYDAAIKVLLFKEDSEDLGVVTNDPFDTGGVTKYGISQRAHPDVDVASLTKEGAITLFHAHYWDADWDKLESSAVATKLFVMAVHMGPATASRYVQEAVNYLGVSRLLVDGVFGPKTLAACNTLDSQRLLDEINVRVVDFYVGIIINSPTQRKWAMGWVRRQLT